MPSKPTIKMAMWVHKQMDTRFSIDDVHDVLLGNITSPIDFVTEVKGLAIAYEEDIRLVG